MKKEFEVMSSDGSKFYVVSFEFDSGKLRIYCNCEAGGRSKWCKHKTQLVLGNLSCLRNNAQSSDIQNALEWVENSKLAQLVGEIHLAEDEMKKAKVRKDRATKQLEKAAREGA